MKKIFIFSLITLLILPSILALDLEIEKTSEGEVMIAGIDKPVLFDFRIKNLGPDNQIEFYNLLGFRMLPTGKISIKAFETKEITLSVSPIGEFDYLGFYTFGYFIQDTNGSKIEKTLTFKRLELKDAFEIGSGEFNPESNSIEIFISNKENFDFGKANVKFSSAFFNLEESFSIGPKETREFTIGLNKEDFKQLLAGFYTMEAEIKIEDQVANLEGQLKFVEKDIIETQERSYGFIINTKVITKTNEGNVLASAQISSKKNIISRLFTSFSPEPDIVERSGLSVQYTWSKSIKPGEVLEVSIKTNWLFPLLIILLIIAIVVLAKQYTKTNLVLRKKINFVRVKGGEFALKVTIFAHAKKYIENVRIVDRLPPLVKLYEKFGSVPPTKVDHKARKLEWVFDKLEAGEVRMMTYIIYSKVGVFGKFALPSARSTFEKDGQFHESESNKTFFVSEQKGQDMEEE